MSRNSPSGRCGRTRGGDGTGVHASGPSVLLRAEAAGPLAMMLHELATNASKYGALSVPGGSASLAWSTNGDAGVESWMRLEWRERGGPVVKPPAKEGFGLSLIRGMAEYELGGKIRIDFGTQGFTCDVSLPASVRAADSAAQ